MYEEVPAQLEKLALAKNRWPLLNQEIAQGNTFKQHFQKIQPQFEQNREKILKFNHDQQELEKNKLVLSEELPQVQKSLTLNQQNQQETVHFFSAYLKEIATLQDQYTQYLQQHPLTVPNNLSESTLPEAIRIQFTETQRLFFCAMWCRLLEICHHRLFLMRHPWLQQEDLKRFAEAYSQELQKIQEIKVGLDPRINKAEPLFIVSWDLPELTAESWSKEFLAYAPIREAIKKTAQDWLTQYQESQNTLAKNSPEASLILLQEIQKFFQQSSAFPSLGEGIHEWASLLDNNLAQLQKDIDQKQQELFQTLQEVASIFQMQQDLQQKILQKKYLIALISVHEEETQRDLQEIQTQQEKLQTEYETLSLAIQKLPALEEEQEQLSQQLKIESELQEKEQQRQLTQQKEKQLTQQIIDLKAILQSLQEAHQQYLQNKDQSPQMEKTAQEIQQLRQQIEQIPQIESEITGAKHQIEDLQQEIKILQMEWQKKCEQLQRLEEKRQLLQQILNQEQSWKEQRQNLENQIQRKRQFQQELLLQQDVLQEEPSVLLQKELLQKKIQIREDQLKKLDSLQISIAQEKELLVRLDSYRMVDSLIAEMAKQIQSAQQELDIISNQIAQIPQ